MLQHAAADQDLFTLADVVFPGFLFVVGVSIPVALTRRKAGGAKTPAVLGHILVRTLALLFLGVLLVNENLYSTAVAGIDKDLWYFLAILAVITLWAVIPTEARPQARRFHLVLKVAAAVNEFVDIGSLFGSYAAIVTAGMLAGTFFLPGTDVPSVRGRISYIVILG